MKCAICRTGETKQGETTVTLHRGESVVVIKNVPAEVCDNCGEYYLDEFVAGNVYAQADSAAKRKAEVEITHYAA